MQFKKKASPRYLYHITPVENTKSILKDGLIPSLSQGKYERVWACELDEIDRISKHLYIRANRECVEYSIFVITSTWLHQFTRHASPGVWTTKELIAPANIQHAYMHAVDTLGVRSISQSLSLLTGSLVNTTLSGR